MEWLKVASKKPSDKLKSTPPSTQAGTELSGAELSGGSQFPIAGVGASAGGLEAFTQLLENLPADSGMAFVLVQHLAASHESILTELLSKVTPMPVTEVKDGMKVEPDHVYVIPPGTEMAILHGILHLLPRMEARGQHMPVDSFLRSLAEDRGDDSIAVILSGTGSDGSLGVRAIKAEGGITFAQEEKSAKYSGMPGSAIATGCVDFVLPPDKIAGELLRISRHPYLAAARHEETAQAMAEEEDNLSKLFILLRTAKGVDFTYFKPSTLRRRIMRRMLLLKIEKIESYIKYARENPSEVEALYQDILINVTSFFREPETCEALKSSVFPHIAGKTSSDVPIRLWIPGCSTGEEAYSLAICLLEFLDGIKLTRPIQVFATDIDDAAIEKARKGIYPENISKDVSSERLRRFFVKTESAYQISMPIRDMCIFARQNLVKDPPFLKIDLISCRNVLIYFGPVLQKKALPILHYALNPTGFLMLGTSETVGEFSGLFALVDKKNKIYSKKSSLSRLHFEQPLEGYGKEKAGAGKKMKQQLPGLADVQKEADSIILNKYSPAGVVINDDMKILHFRGDISPYLRPAPGEASLNLLKMVSKDLVAELRTAIHKANKGKEPVKKARLRVKPGRGGVTPPLLVDIEVIPFNDPAAKDLYFLILFEESIKPEPPGAGAELVPAPEGKEGGAAKGPADEEEVIQLRHELALTEEYLKSVISEHEAAAEESMALNEELQSSNEEMQSINEELETAREELQSTNEELTTVNDELQSRSEETTVVNNDLINLLTGIEIPVILLGAELQIRRFNPSAGKILNLIASDAGRPITDIRTNLNVPDLKQMIVGVIDTLAIKEQEIQDTEGRWYSIAIRPYKTVDSRIEGVLMTLVDINELKQAEAEREKLISELKEALANVKQLSGMLPICSSCKKIRDDKGYWSQIESYITNHSEALFSHGYCPECAEKVMKELEAFKKDAER
jgi:two-component system, chemotaxis family, CheB/CheR fusion protein